MIECNDIIRCTKNKFQKDSQTDSGCWTRFGNRKKINEENEVIYSLFFSILDFSIQTS
jgi:hypothetical protein